VLYALNWHKGDIVGAGEAGEAVVCEGYTDVIGFAQAGVPRAVATCGTALTEDHLRTLRKFSRRVVLAFDADAAGQNAAARFYEWEHRLDLEVFVAALPKGVDPADLAQHDPAGLQRAVSEAVPFLGFRVNRALEAANLATPEGRARAAEQALGMVAEHPRELVRDQYLMEIAGRTRFEADQLRHRLVAAGSGGRGGGGQGPNRAPAGAGPGRTATLQMVGPETEALKLLIHDPEAADPYLMMDVEHREELFQHPVNLAAFRALAATPGLHEAIAVADAPVADLLVALATEQCDAESLDVMARLVEGAALRELPVLQAEGASTDDVGVYARVAADHAWVILAVEQLRETDTRADAVDQLLAWLALRSEGRQG
jgi:DNA primase